jgi:hypothetical protein
MSTQAGQKGQWPFAKIPKVLFFLALRKKTEKFIGKLIGPCYKFLPTQQTKEKLHTRGDRLYESGFSIRPLFKYKEL